MTRSAWFSPGMFKLGFHHKTGVEVVFICHTTEHRTLCDMVLQVSTLTHASVEISAHLPHTEYIL